MTKEQTHEENYSIYNSDCMEVITTLKDESIDLSVYHISISSCEISIFW